MPYRRTFCLSYSGRVSDLARTETARGELVLRERTDGHVELRANGVFVMDTLEHTSERALAAEALDLAGPGPLRVFVGGLGLGYTVAEALTDDRVGRCTVAELEPDLVTWLRDGLLPHGPALLADSRCDIRIGDVADLLRSAAPAMYDLVLLDVDNGPGNLVHDHNAALYEPSGLAAPRRMLTPRGVLVVWSASPAPALEEAMGEVFGQVRATPYDVPGHGRAGRYWLYSARRGR